MITHGQSSRTYTSRAYCSYHCMIQRCTNKNHKHFMNYGGRGITVCDRWAEKFENFYEDMGDRPEGTTIDRIDNDKGYFKENCKWSTYAEQSRNNRRSAMLSVEGIVMNVTDAAKFLGINSNRIYSRISKYNETPQQAFDNYYKKTPKRNVIFVSLRGETISCREAAKRLGLYDSAITGRVNTKGETHQQACDHFYRKKLIADFRENIQQVAA